MPADNSVIFVAQDADKAAGDAALAAYFGDPPNSPEITIALCPVAVDPNEATPTAWAGAIYLPGGPATALKDWPNGVLPTQGQEGGQIDWEAHGLDETSALAAGEAMTVSLMTGASLDTLALTNLQATITAMGLQKVITPI